MDSRQSNTDRANQSIVHCDRHGDNREAFMCKHLLHESELGFFSDPEEADNPYPDAWCSRCEHVRTGNTQSGAFSTRARTSSLFAENVTKRSGPETWRAPRDLHHRPSLIRGGVAGHFYVSCEGGDDHGFEAVL